MTATIMPATSITPGQKAFIEEITKQVNTMLGSQLPGTFSPMSYPPGFNYAIQYSQPPIYNSIALNTLNSCLQVATNGMLTLSSEIFSTTYFKILTTTKYQYSENDLKVVQDPNIQSQQGAVATEATTSGYASQFSSDFTGAPTYYAVIKSVLKNFSDKPTDWSSGNIAAAAKQLPNAGFASLGQAISNAVNQLAPLNTILGTQSQAEKELDASKNNTQNPSATNGGLQISPTDYYVGWDKLPTNAQVLGGLQSGSSVKISISASNFSSQSTQFSISGSGGFSIPIGDFFSIGISGGASYNMSKYTSSASSLDMELSYPGVSMVQAEPKPLTANYTAGWYDESLLRSIVTGSGDPNISGFKIDPKSQFNVPNTFGPGKPFSRLTAAVISNFPTIKMTFTAGEASAIKTDFQQGSSVKVKLLGLFTIGSVSESYHIQTVDTTSVSGKIVVTLAPPSISGTVPLDKQVCYLLGGVADYPPNV